MKPIIIENHSPTSSHIIATDFLDGSLGNMDMVLRVQSDRQFKTVNVTSTQTQTIRDDLDAYFLRFHKDIDLLRSVIFWQKNTIDYQALHAAFLLNSLTEEEFEEEAEKFTVLQKDVPPEIIANVADRLDSLVGINFETSDYADFFHCTQENVMKGLSLLPTHSRFFALLPPSTQEK